MRKHTLFLVDDHKVVRDGIKAMLLAKPDVEVIGEAGNGDEALQLIPIKKPDIAFIDLKLPDMKGTELIPEVLKSIPHLKIILLTAEPNVADLKTAREAGVMGFLTKDIDTSEYFAALGKIIKGQKHISAAFSELLINEPISYTPRELDVLRLFAEGLSYKEIGAKLEMSPRTVETHKNNLLNKMQVKSIVEMVRIAIREGIIEA